jgi:hypothetical protein
VRHGETFLVASLSVGMLLGGPLRAYAEGPTPGQEVEVSTNATSSELLIAQRSVARAPDGRFVVVYQAETGDFERRADIYARRFAADGTALGTPFVVNAYTTGTQQEPVVAMGPDGRFVVVWFENSFRDGTCCSLFGRVVDAAGEPVGEDDFAVEVSTLTSGRDQDVAMAPDGSFVVVWFDNAADVDGGVVGRAFDANAQPKTGQFSLPSDTAGRETQPAIALDGDGNFVVAWSGGGDYGTNADVSARLFAADGTPCCNASGEPCGPADGPTCGEQFLVNELTADTQNGASVARSSDGRFVVVWQTETSEDDANKKIAARRFDALGNALGTEFAPHVAEGVELRDADVAIDAAGRFVISWETYSSTSYDAGVSARAFHADGAPDGDAFVVSTSTDGSQSDPAVAADAAGHFVVAWHNFGPGESVLARLFEREAAGTTTTLPPTTLPVTTTTLPGIECGDANGDGSVSASDALAVLRGAVGTGECAACVCDVDGSGSVSATDALAVLRAAVSLPVELACVPC